MPDTPVLLQTSDFSVATGDSVSIKSVSLVNALLHDQAGVLSFLGSEVAPVDISAITVDDAGRVVVSDPGFAAAIETKLSTPSPEAWNVICGWHCSLS